MRLNQELEQRVHERTVQLELANAELEMAIEEARAANQAKSAFLSSMSHELRTPLNAILGFAQILASDNMPTTPEQKKEFSGHILKSGRHLLTLINEILDLAKVEAGAVTLTMEAVALGDILAECRGMIAPLAAGRGIDVRFPEQAPVLVEADRTRLKQVLLNLLSNAVKYNRDGGAVVVDCESAVSGRLRLTVRDTGMGLSPEQVAALFQPFNRLGQESGPQEGTGIGLVVTRRLIELMGGEIGVNSSPGVGSVFWIELARAQENTGPFRAAPAAQAVPALPAGGAPHSVLYIEDNPANLRLVEEIVRFRPDLRTAVGAGRTGWPGAGARAPSGGDPDGLEPARHERLRGAGTAARRPADRGDSRAGAVRQRHAARCRAWAGGGVRALHHQADRHRQIQ
jgi:nitrogen-specific signal transduction histidine kinase